MKSKQIFLSLLVALALVVFPSPALATDEHFTGNVEVDGDLNVDSGNITTTAWNGNIFNNSFGNIFMGGSSNYISIGNYWGITYINSELNLQRNVTAKGATFTPDWTDDITINTDSDSTLILNGLNTTAGDPLCLDASNNVVKCAGASERAAASPAQDTSSVDQIKAQQAEIDQLKKDVADLKASLNK
jgi:hypothetical protein